jgi:elongator complex protein 1
LQDPREYLPFLRELRTLEKYYQRFRIDDHLKRHESALRNLSLAGTSRLACVRNSLPKLYTQVAITLMKPSLMSNFTVCTKLHCEYGRTRSIIM